MAGSQYAGTEPPKGVYLLDDGGQVRFFFSERSLAAAVVNGYAQDASGIYKRRPASLQWFGTDGHADISHWIGKLVPLGFDNAEGRRSIAEEILADKSAALRRTPQSSAEDPHEERP